MAAAVWATYNCWMAGTLPSPAIWHSTASKEPEAVSALFQESYSPAMSLAAWSPATTIRGRNTTLR